MSSIPQKPQEIFEEIRNELKQLFGNDLVSVLLYGSGARGYYIPKKSDINFLVVLSDEGINKFHAASAFVKKWQKRKVATPLFLTKNYIKNSMDSFPIEFLNISSYYEVVYGEDIFADFDINKKDLKLQLEREMTGKLIHLRQEYFPASLNTKNTSMLIHDSMSTFLSLFQAILYLKNENISDNNLENLNRIAVLFKLDMSVLEELYNIKSGNVKISRGNSESLLKKYINQMRSLSIQIDEM